MHKRIFDIGIISSFLPSYLSSWWSSGHCLVAYSPVRCVVQGDGPQYGRLVYQEGDRDKAKAIARRWCQCGGIRHTLACSRKRLPSLIKTRVGNRPSVTRHRPNRRPRFFDVVSSRHLTSRTKRYFVRLFVRPQVERRYDQC